MKTYKARVNSQKEYAVTQKDFDMARLDNPNLFQNGRYYGVCPYCNSPVKLIGLTHEIKVAPYAQHTEGDVASVAKKTRKSIYCPANSHKRNADPEERLCAEDEDSIYSINYNNKYYPATFKSFRNFPDELIAILAKYFFPQTFVWKDFVKDRFSPPVKITELCNFYNKKDYLEKTFGLRLPKSVNKLPLKQSYAACCKYHLYHLIKLCS